MTIPPPTESHRNQKQKATAKLRTKATIELQRIRATKDYKNQAARGDSRAKHSGTEPRKTARHTRQHPTPTAHPHPN